MEIWIDGSGFNGRYSKFAFVKDNGDRRVVKTHKDKTNNEMEYTALIEGIKEARGNTIIYTDSQLVAGQMNKGWKINHEHLEILNKTARELISELEREGTRITIVWVPREENKAGKLLEGHT